MQNLGTFMRKITDNKRKSRMFTKYAWRTDDGTIWATDGHRLHVDKVHPDYPYTDIVKSGQHLVDVNNAIKKYKPLHYGTDFGSVPDYMSLFREPFATYKVNMDKFKQALYACKPFLPYEKHVKLTFGTLFNPGITTLSEVHVSSVHPEIGDVGTGLDADLHNTPHRKYGVIEMYFNYDYLYDMIIGLQGLGDHLIIDIRGKFDPVVFGNKDKRFVAIMPFIVKDN